MPPPRRGAKGKGGKFAKGKDGRNQNRGLFRRRKFCRFTAEKIKEVDYKDIAVLKDFINENGKIIPARRLRHNLEGHIGELLAKAIDRKALDDTEFAALDPVESGPFGVSGV